MGVQFKCPDCRSQGIASISGNKLVCAKCNHPLSQEHKIEPKQEKQLKAHDDDVPAASIFAFDKAGVLKFLKNKGTFVLKMIGWLMTLVVFLFGLLRGMDAPAPMQEQPTEQQHNGRADARNKW